MKKKTQKKEKRAAIMIKLEPGDPRIKNFEKLKEMTGCKTMSKALLEAMDRVLEGKEAELREELEKVKGELKKAINDYEEVTIGLRSFKHIMEVLDNRKEYYDSMQTTDDDDNDDDDTNNDDLFENDEQEDEEKNYCSDCRHYVRSTSECKNINSGRTHTAPGRSCNYFYSK